MQLQKSRRPLGTRWTFHCHGYSNKFSHM